MFAHLGHKREAFFQVSAINWEEKHWNKDAQLSFNKTERFVLFKVERFLKYLTDQWA